MFCGRDKSSRVLERTRKIVYTVSPCILNNAPCSWTIAWCAATTEMSWLKADLEGWLLFLDIVDSYLIYLKITQGFIQDTETECSCGWDSESKILQRRYVQTNTDFCCDTKCKRKHATTIFQSHNLVKAAQKLPFLCTFHQLAKFLFWCTLAKQ